MSTSIRHSVFFFFLGGPFAGSVRGKEAALSYKCCELFCGIALLVEWRWGVVIEGGVEGSFFFFFHVPGKQHYHTDLSEKEVKKKEQERSKLSYIYGRNQ